MRIGFTTETGRARDRWDEFTAVCGATRQSVFVRCCTDRLLDTICDAALAGVRVAGPTTADPIHRLLNSAWDEFWRDPAGYTAWERKAVEDMFARVAA